MYIIGLDIGTTSVCGILCDAATGEICRSITRPNGTFLNTPNPWEKLQDPVALMGRLQEIAAELRAIGPVDAIGVTGQMHGIVYLNKDGQPVSPLAIWQDGRGDQLYKDGMTYAQYLTKVTGYPLATGYGAVTHFYNTVNNLVPADAVTFCTIHDLAVMTLTGNTAPLLDPSDAASLGLYDLKNDCFDAAAITAAGMDPAFFPAVSTNFALAGKTADGIPVSVAIGDNQASVLGSVSDLTHSVLVNVGTGSQISCVVTQPPVGSDLDCRPLMPGHWLLAGSSLCGGRAYAILEKFLRDTASLISGTAVDSAYSVMGQLMTNYEAPAEPLVVDTTFSGTRKQPTRRGSISGISIDNLTAANLCDGVMNGMVAELHDLYSEMKPYLSATPTRLVGSGNGIRMNAPLAARFSNTFGLPLSTPKHREEAAFGSALFAMVAAGLVEDIATAQTRIQYQ